MSNARLPQYDTKLFTEVWDTASEFVSDYQTVGIPTTISVQSATTLYYLLYARYGNTPIANYDETQWKYKMFSVVFQYGPTWEKRLSIQQTLRGLSLSDLTDNGSMHELFEHEASSESESSKTGSLNKIDSGSTTSTGTQTVTHTGTSETDKTGTQTLRRTGTSELERTGTQTTDKTGTSTNESTGTQGVAHTGTVTVDHDNEVTTDNETEDIKNHAYNPNTTPASNAYSPLAYINEQNANKNTLDGSSVQDETNLTTFANTDTTTNNLTNSTTNDLQDLMTNDLSDLTTNDLTDATTNDLSDLTTNNLTDETTNDLAGTSSNSSSASSSDSGTVEGSESSTNETTTTLTTGKLKAYEKLLELLQTDVTGEFINKFKICFKQFVMPERTWIYVTDNDYEEDDE